jgi:hypothetical protein
LSGAATVADTFPAVTLKAGVDVTDGAIVGSLPLAGLLLTVLYIAPARRAPARSADQALAL